MKKKRGKNTHHKQRDFDMYDKDSVCSILIFLTEAIAKCDGNGVPLTATNHIMSETVFVIYSMLHNMDN